MGNLECVRMVAVTLLINSSFIFTYFGSEFTKDDTKNESPMRRNMLSLGSVKTIYVLPYLSVYGVFEHIQQPVHKTRPYLFQTILVNLI